MKRKIDHTMSNTPQTGPLTPASCERLFTFLKTLPGALFIIDDAATIVYANASAQAITGATQEDLYGKLLWRGAPQLVSTALYQAVQQTKRTQAPTEVEYVSPATRARLHVQLSPAVEGLMIHFHEKREPFPCQEALFPNEHLAADVLENMYVGVAFLTPEGILLEINEAPLEDAQIQREEVIGQPFAETVWWTPYPTSQDQIRDAITRASLGETVHFETVVHPREGMDVYLEVTMTPHRDADHHVSYLVYVGADITAHKRTEAEIHALIDAIPQLVWLTRPDGYCIYNNQRLTDYLGMRSEQVKGTGWLDGAHPDDRQRVWQAWQTSIQAGIPYETEFRLQDGTSGAYRWFLARGVPQRDAQGTILRWVGTCTDIEEKKQAEQRLKESEQDWHALAETVPQLVWRAQPDGSTEYLSQRWYDYTGSSPEQLAGYQWSQFLHPDDYEHTLMAWRHALKTGETYEIEHRLKEGQTGAYRWFLVRAIPVRNESGQIVKWFGTSTDIEDRRQIEQRLKESEQNWRTLAETVPQLVWTASPDGQFEYVNQRSRDYTGVTLEYRQGDRWAHLQFIHPDDRERARVQWQHALDTGDIYESEGRIRNSQTGEYRWFLVRAIPVRNESGQIVKWFGTSTDIEEQKRVEEALRQSQERANVLMNSSIIGIFVDENNQIVDANDAFLRMTGYTREDLQAGRMNVIHMTAPEYLARTLQAHQTIDTRQTMMPYEKEYICKDGSRLPVLVGAILFQHHPRRVIVFVLDNSVRQELEQRKDNFISMASHELRTPLTALKLQTALLRRQLVRQDLQTAISDLDLIETQINALIRLVEELLDVSKIQAGKQEYVWEKVDLNVLLREIAQTMQHSHPDHRILVHGTGQASLIGDRERLRQVFSNLFSNAIKYDSHTQTAEVELSVSEEAITIRVTDHGPGIPAEQRDKIFERFYRVTGSRQGTIPGLGMGLYIASEIVKGHGGTITVDSEVGKGSTFTVTLPKRR